VRVTADGSITMRAKTATITKDASKNASRLRRFAILVTEAGQGGGRWLDATVIVATLEPRAARA
jgi:hypothetical protein